MTEERNNDHTDHGSPDTAPDISVGTPPPSPDFGEVKSDERTMAMLCHLLALFTGFLGPLLIWLIKKDQSAFINDQGKESLNFQITILFVYILGGITACLIVGFFIMGIAAICHIVFCIIASLQANKGVAYRYPFAIRLIK